MHTRCHRKQNTRPVGEIRDKETDGGGKKIEERKGKLRKVLAPLEKEALVTGKVLIRQSLSSVSKLLMQKCGQEKFSSCSWQNKSTYPIRKPTEGKSVLAQGQMGLSWPQIHLRWQREAGGSGVGKDRSLIKYGKELGAFIKGIIECDHFWRQATWYLRAPPLFPNPTVLSLPHFCQPLVLSWTHTFSTVFQEQRFKAQKKLGCYQCSTTQFYTLTQIRPTLSLRNTGPTKGCKSTYRSIPK